MAGDGMTGFVMAALETRAVRVSAKTIWVFLRVTDRDGVDGWGEATLPDARSYAALAAAISGLRSALVGRAFAGAIDPIAALAPGEVPTGLPAAAALSAMDQALSDLAARRAGVPIAAMLGAPRADRVGLYANINRRTLDRTPAGFAASARTALAQGFAAFKIAPFDAVTPAIAADVEGRRLIAAGLARAAAVRDAIGPDAALMIDCHWRLTEATARDVLDAAQGLRLHWLECALPEQRELLPAMRRVRERANALGVLTAGCETMIGVGGFAPFLDARAYDVIMPDVKYAGGVRELLRIAERAAVAGVACSLHNPSGPICHAHSIQASAAIGGDALLEHQFDESPLFLELVRPRIDGFAAPRAPWRCGPGLGVDLDVALAEAHAQAWPPA